MVGLHRRFGTPGRDCRGSRHAFNLRLLDEVHRYGRLFLGPMTVAGRVGLRDCVVNFRSSTEDARRCIDTVAELGQRLEEGSAS